MLNFTVLVLDALGRASLPPVTSPDRIDGDARHTDSALRHRDLPQSLKPYSQLLN